ncbi:MAG: DNA polymerase III subunit delta' [Desulfovibrionaceae bacterium]|nr:DNA polymerase III subunit delta' [Desulfovibrionaceae bacterium]
MDAALLPALAAPAFDRLKTVLGILAQRAPQVLLLEGGNESERLAAARYWAACCNCEQERPPCLACAICRQIAAGEYLDVLAYDGRISNKEDTENPGPVRAFNMEQARELKSRLRDAPHGSGRRVVVLSGLGQNRDEAANALLKVLEEPSPNTLFCLLTPQREQLLPTLVSRSFCLTLPWSDTAEQDPALAHWEELLAEFLHSGRGLLEKTSAKNALDAALTGQILLALQKSLARVLAGGACGPLDTALTALDAQGHAACARWLDEAQTMLRYGVTPARILEALATRLFVQRGRTV